MVRVWVVGKTDADTADYDAYTASASASAASASASYGNANYRPQQH